MNLGTVYQSWKQARKWAMKMGKEVLLQLVAMRGEVKDLERRIKEAENKIERCSRSVVSDVVKGSKGEHYIYGPIKIMDQKKEQALENAEKEKNKVEEEWKKAKDKVDEKIKEAELYIQSVGDSDMRKLLRLRCEDDLTFLQVSKKMRRKGWGEDRCRKTFNDFMKK